MIKELDIVETNDGTFRGEVVNRHYNTIIVYNAKKDIEKKLKTWEVKKI